MKTRKQTDREASRLFRLCRVGGWIDEERARAVVHDLVASERPGRFAMLSRFARLVRLDRQEHTAEVACAAPLPDDVRATIAAGLARMHGSGITVSFAEQPDLIGGVRIRVGSNVYDGSVKGRLRALESAW